MSPSRPLFTKYATLSSFESESNPPEVFASIVGGASMFGIAGFSIDPLLIFTIIAFAFPLMILSSQLFTASMSPSRPLFTRYATLSSFDSESNPPDDWIATEPPSTFSGSGGSLPVLLDLTIPALAIPRMVFSGIAFT